MEAKRPPMTASPEGLNRALTGPAVNVSQGVTDASGSSSSGPAHPPLNSLLVTLVRHGESQDNLKSIWAGVRDSPLSTTGQSQARAVGKAFASVPIAAIYSSDLKRAASTADEILKQNLTQPPPTLVQSQSLREQNFGQAEGKPWSSAEWQTLSSGEDARTVRFQDGESLEDVNARVATAVRRFVLPRAEALRREPPSQTHDAASLALATGGNVPHDVPHIVIVAHGIAIAELLRVFMSLHDNDPPGMQAPWADPRQSYRRVRLENTGWTRLQIAVPANVAASSSPSANFGSAKTETGLAPSGTGVVSNQSFGSVTDAGQMQTMMVEGPADVQKQPPSSHSAGRNIFVRILVQNNIDHLNGFVLQPPTSGGPANLLGGGAGGNSSGGSRTGVHDRGASGDSAVGNYKGLTPSNTSSSLAQSYNPTTPTFQTTGTLSIGRSPNALLATPASARSLNAYDSRFLAREMEKATSGAALQSIAGVEPGAGVGASNLNMNPSQSTSTVGSSAMNAYSFQNMLNQVPSIGVADMSAAPPGVFAPTSDAWQSICIKVLPLFNGEGLKTSFDELNTMVSLHVRKTIERSPARALDSLHSDIAHVTSVGMYTLSSRLSALQGEALLRQLAAVWTEYFCNVLPNLETAFLPVQTDPDIVSLTQGKATRPTLAGNNSQMGSSTSTSQVGSSTIPTTPSNPQPSTGLRKDPINVRKILLAVFRDDIVFPRYEQLIYHFAHIRNFHTLGNDVGDEDEASDNALHPRLLQMISVVASILSDDPVQNAVDRLLKALRIGSKGGSEAELDALGWSAVAGSSTQSTHKQNRRGWLPRLTLKHSNFGAPLPQQPQSDAEARVSGPAAGGGMVQAMSIGDEEDSVDSMLAAAEHEKPYLESDDFLEELKSGGRKGGSAGKSAHPYGQALHASGDGRQPPQPPSAYGAGFSQDVFLNSLRSPALSDDAHATPLTRSPVADREQEQGQRVDHLAQRRQRGPAQPIGHLSTAASTDKNVSPTSFMDFIVTPIQSAPPTGIPFLNEGQRMPPFADEADGEGAEEGPEQNDSNARLGAVDISPVSSRLRNSPQHTSLGLPRAETPATPSRKSSIPRDPGSSHSLSAASGGSINSANSAESPSSSASARSKTAAPSPSALAPVAA